VRPIVITQADFRFVVAEQLRERSIEADIVLEPMRRDSGPAVAVAAVLAAERDRNTLVLVLAADHVIRKPEEFRATCRSTASAAAEGRIVTFGIEPTGRVTSYGYIGPGKKLNGASVRAVEAFAEKPDADTAAHENEWIYIPIGSIHRLGNPGKIPLELIEVQVGSYLGEDDIVWLEDVYGRVAFDGSSRAASNLSLATY
jgi:hypothetical protein